MSLLAEWRRSCGLSQEQFGELIGANQSIVSRYERGTQVPRPGRVSLIVSLSNGQLTPADIYAAAFAPKPKSPRRTRGAKSRTKIDVANP